ncbi:MAG: nitroreductase family protein [Planctomycetota bacterium]|jgi:nitroreductase|nr:nitroreductase family protein [Planctomycetota bacterium]
METLAALAKRKSVRDYQNRGVEKEKLAAVIAAGRQAPKAGPVQFTVVREAECLKRLNDATLAAMKNSGNEFLVGRASLPGYQPLYGAPVLILVSAPSGPYARDAAAGAVVAMTIAATDLGLGSCYVVSPVLGLAGEPGLTERLALPEGFAPLCGVLLGYPGGDRFSTPAAEAAENVNFV